MTTSLDFRDNRLLNGLSGAEGLRLIPHLEPIQMPMGFVVYDGGRPQSHGYFPVGALVSIQYVMADGSVGETAAVGSEGMVGISIFMGGESTPGRAVVKSAGHAFRLPAPIIKQEFSRAGPVMHRLLRYTQALLTQMSQTAVCNRHHSIDAQLCRVLLLSLDHSPDNELSMTQEMIAGIIGIRREGVTESAGRLQRAGLIRYSRGHISVIDRSGLEDRTCECYVVVKTEYERLLSARAPPDPGVAQHGTETPADLEPASAATQPWTRAADEVAGDRERVSVCASEID